MESLLRLKQGLQVAISRSLRYMLIKELCMAGTSRQNSGTMFLALAHAKGAPTKLLFQGRGLVWRNSTCSPFAKATSETIV